MRLTGGLRKARRAREAAAARSLPRIRFGRIVALFSVGTVVATLTWVVALTSVSIAKRAAFPFDLLYWPDDYFMTVLMKIDAGRSPYSPPAEANSWIYAPGGPYLHWLLLAPLGLVRSFAANKALALTWLVGAVGLGTWAGWQLASALAWLPVGRVSRALFAVVLALMLALAACTNPVADSLHPTNLELMFITGAVGLAARWPSLTEKQRMVIALVLPALAVAAKQTAGLVTAGTFTALALLTGGSWRARVAGALLPAAGVGAMLGLLTLTSRGWFWVWCYTMPRGAPWEMWKTRDLTHGMGLWLYPSLAVIAAKSLHALAQRPREWAWFRGLLPIAAYTPLALIALLKALGGPNNLTVLSFLYAVPTGTVLAHHMTTGATLRRVLACNLAALLAFAIWLPQKRVPGARDYEHGETVCRYFEARTRCGERVLLPRGAACFARTGIAFPRDRAMPAMDAAVAGHGLQMTERLLRREYDIVILEETDLRSAWLRGALAPLRTHYVEFGQIEGGQAGDLWLEGWGDLMAGPVSLFERNTEAGRHRVDQSAFECPTQPPPTRR